MLARASGFYCFEQGALVAPLSRIFCGVTDVSHTASPEAEVTRRHFGISVAAHLQEDLCTRLRDHFAPSGCLESCVVTSAEPLGVPPDTQVHSSDGREACIE